MAAMLTGLALMAFSSEAAAQASRTVRKSEKTSVTKPDSEKSKKVTRTAPASRPQATRPQAQKPAAKPDKPQPQKPAAKPQKPAAKPDKPQPQKPAAKPGKPQPQKPAARPDRPGGYDRPDRPGRPDGPQRPPSRPDKYRPGRPDIVPARPPRPRPRPIVAPRLIFRPAFGAVFAINVFSDDLRLKKVRLRDDVDYFYEDGAFYVINDYGTYYEIDPPAGALIDRLPEDLRKVRIDGREYYRYEDTVYRLVVVEGVPYFEVLGQMY